jgi:pimeloyl-ACP methyl ester carboxylesterase
VDDALRVPDAAGPTGRDVFIGHGWGALAGAGLAAMPDSPFTKAVIMSVPISAAFRPLGRVPQSGRLAAKLPRRWHAALGYYRAAIRNSRPPAQYAELHRHWLSAPRLPTLHLHGTDDGCSEDYTPWIELPAARSARCCRAAHRRLRGTGLVIRISYSAAEFGTVRCARL